MIERITIRNADSKGFELITRHVDIEHDPHPANAVGAP